jgi:pimeloyl-ACP methyl ester carboxylesterase
VNGTELYYEVAGDGPCVVFAHGGEGTRIHWRAQVAAIQTQYRCVTYDAQPDVFNALVLDFLAA